MHLLSCRIIAWVVHALLRQSWRDWKQLTPQSVTYLLGP